LGIAAVEKALTNSWESSFMGRIPSW